MSLQTTQKSLVEVSTVDAGVAVVKLNRPLKRNSLSQGMIDELTGSLRRLDQDAAVRAIVLTSIDGSPFCAGADLNELAKISTGDAYRIGWLKDLEIGFSSLRTPCIAAVRGFAMGGGFEIALMCDMIYTTSDAQFGLPEVKLGTIPGAGGTQRLCKALGKQKTMQLVLTGSSVPATELERLGVVNKVVAADEDVVDEAVRVAKTIAAYSAPAVGLAKQAVKAGEATTLDAGLEVEKALYYSSFGLADCEEGISAFLQKRVPRFEHH